MLPSFHGLHTLIQTYLQENIRGDTNPSLLSYDTSDKMKTAVIHVLVFGLISGLTSGAGVLPDDLVYKAVGETVKFHTDLTSAETPFVTITWLFEEKLIFSLDAENYTGPGYEGRITVFISTGSLELRDLTLSDTGKYSVTIVAGAFVHAGSITLNVLERISGASVTPSTDQTIEGNSVNLICDAAAGSVLNRKWMKDGSDLTLSDHMTFHEENRVLSFQPLRNTDKGEYSCKISNPVSSMKAKYSLTVNYGPVYISVSRKNTLPAGDTIILICSAVSEPPANLTWLFNGTEIHSPATYIKEDAQVSDSGNYTCTAKNDVTGNSLDVSFNVTVIEVIDEGTGGLSGGAIAGIVIACLIVVTGFAVGGYFIFQRKFIKRRQPMNPGQPQQPQEPKKSEHVHENSSFPEYENI